MVGIYSNENDEYVQIKSLSNNSCLVKKIDDQPWAIVTEYNQSYLFSFTEGIDRILTAVYENNFIYFSNKITWKKIR